MQVTADGSERKERGAVRWRENGWNRFHAQVFTQTQPGALPAIQMVDDIAELEPVSTLRARIPVSTSPVVTRARRTDTNPNSLARGFFVGRCLMGINSPVSFGSKHSEPDGLKQISGYLHIHHMGETWLRFCEGRPNRTQRRGFLSSSRAHSEDPSVGARSIEGRVIGRRCDGPRRPEER